MNRPNSNRVSGAIRKTPNFVVLYIFFEQEGTLVATCNDGFKSIRLAIAGLLIALDYPRRIGYCIARLVGRYTILKINA